MCTWCPPNKSQRVITSIMEGLLNRSARYTAKASGSEPVYEVGMNISAQIVDQMTTRKPKLTNYKLQKDTKWQVKKAQNEQKQT